MGCKEMQRAIHTANKSWVGYVKGGTNEGAISSHLPVRFLSNSKVIKRVRIG